MIDESNSTLTVGGNRFKHWLGTRIQNLGKKIQKRGEKLISKGKPQIVTNPTYKLVNPFTLLISFTVDSTDKYQVILQGNYKDHYKAASESEDSTIPTIGERELFILIQQSHKNWYKKS